MSILTDKTGESHSDFILAVQMGKVNGAYYMWKYGYSEVNINTSFNTVRDNGSGLYIYHIGYGTDAKKIDLISTDMVSDSGKVYEIIGLDKDGRRLTEELFVGETSQNEFSRIFKMKNANGVPSVGDISTVASGTSNAIAFASIDAQNTLMSMFTIPLGYTGFLDKGVVSIGSGKEGLVDFSIREYEKIFRTSERIILYEDMLDGDRPSIPIPELSDIEVRFKPVQSDTKISASFGLLLLENDRFSLEH